MRIGLLTASASRRAAGVWVSVAQLGKALAECGLEVEIFAGADDPSRRQTGGRGHHLRQDVHRIRHHDDDAAAAGQPPF